MIPVIPYPNGTVEILEKRIPVPRAFAAELDGFAPWCVEAFCARQGVTAEGAEPWLTLTKDEAFSGEGYALAVGESGVIVRAGSEIGVVWALTTLHRLAQEGTVPLCQITDWPKFGYRGLSLDCARHYFSVETVKQVIEQLSLSKMNVLHWHLSDDQAWRIESKVFPRLCETSGLYYTQGQIREIVAYAHIRGVEVIPEIDLPGHTLGILAAYPEYSCEGVPVELAATSGIFPTILCAGKEETFTFLEALFEEICPLFPSARFHVGGDEAPKSRWKKCPRCQQRMRSEGLGNEEDLQGWFTIRVEKLLKKHGKQIICWNDTLKSSLLPERMLVQYWTLQHASRMKDYVGKGGSYIYSEMFDLYLDYPHSMVPLKKIYGCTPRIGRFRCAPENGMVGLECCLWAEHILTPEQLYKRLFPRVFALAEKAWTEKLSYSRFRGNLKPMLAAMDRADIGYTPENWWDPAGKGRLEESLAFVENMMGGAVAEEDSPTTNPVFLLNYATQFFKPTDIPRLLKFLKK